MIGESPNELELLATRSGTGDTQAFDVLVRRTHRLAYQLALRMLGNGQDVDDVLQEAYLRVWQGLPAMRDPSLVVSWICCLQALTIQARPTACLAQPYNSVVGATGLHGLG